MTIKNFGTLFHSVCSYTFHRIGNEFSILVENELKSVVLYNSDEISVSVLALRLCVHAWDKIHLLIFFLFRSKYRHVVKKRYQLKRDRRNEILAAVANVEKIFFFCIVTKMIS